jgi:hypothetical protein
MISHLNIAIFFCGVGGSLAVEVVTLYQLFQNDPFILPPRYKSWLFWLIRTAVSAIAGGLAVFYGVDKPLLAVNIGASAPLIIKQFTEGFKT